MERAAQTTKVRLVERHVGNQFVITSPDVPGLYVAHVDPETARRDVDAAIAAMERVRERIANRTAVKRKAAFVT